MTEPRQPKTSEQRQPQNQPAPEQQTGTNPHGHAPNGIPHGESEGEPKAWPSSDRQETETAAREPKE